MFTTPRNSKGSVVMIMARNMPAEMLFSRGIASTNPTRREKASSRGKMAFPRVTMGFLKGIQAFPRGTMARVHRETMAKDKSPGTLTIKVEADSHKEIRIPVEIKEVPEIKGTSKKLEITGTPTKTIEPLEIPIGIIEIPIRILIEIIETLIEIIEIDTLIEIIGTLIEIIETLIEIDTLIEIIGTLIGIESPKETLHIETLPIETLHIETIPIEIFLIETALTAITPASPVFQAVPTQQTSAPRSHSSLNTPKRKRRTKESLTTQRPRTGYNLM
mgnify:CR=1 FL=1